MLHLCSGNQLEILADQLASELAIPSRNILEPELIAVPGPSFSRWLSLRMAHQNGICANIHWHSPAELIWCLFRATLPDAHLTNAFSPDVLVWRILEILSNDRFTRKHKSLLNYLASGDAVQCWQLAKQLGRVYEQYLIYRPDWIDAWEQSRVTHWQAALWRELIDKGSNRHWLILQRQVLKLLNEDPPTLDKLPSRISLFALPALSTGYLELLQALSEHIEVIIYHQNFSMGYWADIVPTGDRRQGISFGNGTTNHCLEAGNSLLATMGRQGREHIISLMQVEASEREFFRSPSSSGLLGCIQADIFEQKERSNKNRFVIEPNDNSLEIHICYNMMREVEILHDQLLDALNADKTLSPSDILVFIPDIKTYAPYVEAVFGSAVSDRYLPWQMTCTHIDAHNPVIETFFALLDLPLGRFEADKITILLEQRPIQRKFGFLEADKEHILHWVRELGICWGSDGATTYEVGFSVRGNYTWCAGTDRLLLGHAFGDSDRSFSGILPSMPSETDESEIVGRLRTFLEKLIQLRKNLNYARPLEDWIELAHQVLEEFFQFEEVSDEVIHLQDCLRAISKDVTISKYEGNAPLSVFKAALKNQGEITVRRQFLPGVVTFVPLSNAQILPAEVICVVGLNNGSFPRRDTVHSFDLIRAQPRCGDRRLRDEDRNSFLEILLSARKRLYFSYVGRNLRDDSESLPSALLSELIEYVDSTCEKVGSELGSDTLTKYHPIRPFDIRYFDLGEPELFSYMSEFLPLNQARAERVRPLLPKALPALRHESLLLETLAQFFANPARMLLRDRLGIHLDRTKAMVRNREPFHVNIFGEYYLSEVVLKAQLKGESYDTVRDILYGTGLIPLGTSGDLFVRKKWREMFKLSSRLIPVLQKTGKLDIEIDGVVDGLRLKAQPTDISEKGLIFYVASQPRPGELIRFWIFHLARDALATNPNQSTRIFTPKKILILNPTSNAAGMLKDLVSIYREGMTRPLPFFPRSAWAYITAKHTPSVAAEKEWTGSDYRFGEGNNRYYDLAFRDNRAEVLGEAFQETTKRIFGPVYDHFVEEDLL